ncbi:MAG: two-component sensor histidine kinase, partial [Winogradskyella sp.]|nr:two-component sensor histidine kinase [Winogradskyella sp.]
MSKRIFILLVVLMSLSLVGIIFVQLFFIRNSLTNEEQQFTRNVKAALSYVSRSIEEIELRNYYNKIQPLVASGKEPDSKMIQQLFVTTDDDINNKTIIHRNTVLEERFKVPSLFFEIDADSISVSTLSNERVTKYFNNNTLDEDITISPERTLVEYSSLPELRKKLFESTFKDLFKDFPIYKRINTEQVKVLLQRELSDEGIDIDFEFSIYDDDLATKVQTDNFEKKDAYGIPIF